MQRCEESLESPGVTRFLEYLGKCEVRHFATGMSCVKEEWNPGAGGAVNHGCAGCLRLQWEFGSIFGPGFP